MRVAGIDPGADGAIFVLENGSPSTWAVMPTTKVQSGFLMKRGRLKRDAEGNKRPKFKTEIDIPAMVKIFRNFAPDYIFLEQVWARPDQGVVSMFSFGKALGCVLTAYAWLGIEMCLVRPQEWQNGICLPEWKKMDAKAMVQKACKTFWPDLDLRRSKRSRKPHQGLCDAACIAEYGRRKLMQGAMQDVEKTIIAEEEP